MKVLSKEVCVGVNLSEMIVSFVRLNRQICLTIIKQIKCKHVYIEQNLIDKLSVEYSGNEKMENLLKNSHVKYKHIKQGKKDDLGLEKFSHFYIVILVFFNNDDVFCRLGASQHKVTLIYRRNILIKRSRSRKRNSIKSAYATVILLFKQKP